MSEFVESVEEIRRLLTLGSLESSRKLATFLLSLSLYFPVVCLSNNILIYRRFLPSVLVSHREITPTNTHCLPDLRCLSPPSIYHVVPILRGC